MTRYWMGLAAGCALLLACAPSQQSQADSQAAAPESASAPAAPGAAAPSQAVALRCQPTAPLENRSSPYDSVTLALGDAQAKVCYGRPSLNGRAMIGSERVPYDTIWRTGANEPTIIHLPVAARIAGVAVQPGSYSIYTVPGREQWQVIVNRSTSQWGHESRYTAQVRAQEVGRGTVRPERTSAPVETFTISAQPTAGGSDLVLEWEGTRVRIPVVRG